MKKLSKLGAPSSKLNNNAQSKLSGLNKVDERDEPQPKQMLQTNQVIDFEGFQAPGPEQKVEKSFDLKQDAQNDFFGFGEGQIVQKQEQEQNQNWPNFEQQQAFSMQNDAF